MRDFERLSTISLQLASPVSANSAQNYSPMNGRTQRHSFNQDQSPRGEEGIVDRGKDADDTVPILHLRC